MGPAEEGLHKVGKVYKVQKVGDRYKKYIITCALEILVLGQPSSVRTVKMGPSPRWP